MNKWLGNLKITRKLLLAFLVAAMIALIVGAVGLVSIRKLNNSGTMLYEENTLGLNYLGSAYADFNNLRYNVVRFATAETSADREGYASAIKDLRASVEDLLTKYESTYITSQVTDDYKNTKTDWETYQSDIDQDMQAGSIAKETTQLGDSLENSFKKLMEVDVPAAKAKCDSNLVLARNTTIIMIATLLLGAVIALYLGMYISGTISKPMEKFATFAEMLAIGDIDIDKVLDEKDKLLKNRKDEVGTLAKSFHDIIASTVEQAHKTQAIAEGDLTTSITIRSENDIIGKELSELVERFHTLAASIVSAADQVASGADLVSNSSTSLSQGATEQASTVEELTASLEEISSQTSLNAQNADKANEIATTAKTNANSGNTQMKEMLGAMDEINTSSASIYKIIKVIEDIAFQTNILALNAAVEAARAGQHGKGFAVVAEEVRTLAARSSKAANETAEMIEDSIKKVESGTKIAKNTADALVKIVDEVDKVADLVNSIAVASKEQAQGVEQINQGLVEVSQVVQTNAATSEESAAASEELSGQADQLKEYVSVFKLKGSSQTAPVIDKMDKKNEKDPEKPKVSSPAKSNAGKAKIALSDSEFGKY